MSLLTAKVHYNDVTKV